ncbi:MAG: lysine--tRNA ligase [Candidatus Hydrogenedentes bacterium]|nr:lysine--tRNA ligase [Candidatus Hydrogenedentota bacterium]
MPFDTGAFSKDNPLAQKLEKLFTNIKEKIEQADDQVITPEDRKLIRLLEEKLVDEALLVVEKSHIPGLKKTVKVCAKTISDLVLHQEQGKPAAPVEEHHSTAQDLYQHRLDKLERIRARGDEPFKYAFTRSHPIQEARSAFEAAEATAAEGEACLAATLAGRLVAFRDQGKTCFADLRDEDGRIQVWLNQKEMGEEAFATLKDLDLGDIVGVSGQVKRTKRGEITVFAESYTLLTKSLRASAEKYHGLKDVETRYRQRYLDMVANPEVLGVFKKRIQVVACMREWLNKRGYLEVETPMLHPIPGGATARPFITHHNTYDHDFYLRVAPELYLKRLTVGGFDKVFEINRCFRNEGVDTRHNPEFTTMELYEAYQDYLGLMDETEEMLRYVIEQVAGSASIEYQGSTIDVGGAWKRMTLHDAIREYAGIDLESTRDRAEAARLAKSVGVEVDATMGYGRIVDEVLSLKVQPHLIQPTFLYDYPLELSPLAKKKRDNPALTERFQPFIACLEIGNAFSELNDPIDQRERFEAQVALREAGDEEAQYLDEDFITALEVGMPPTAGLGIGIDRLAMLVTNSASIREVIFFPQLRTL